MAAFLRLNMEEINIEHFLKIVATFATLIPICAGAIRYKTAGKPFRLFLIFLVYGFITDLLVWQLMTISRETSFFLFIIFPLVEALFMLWFIRATNTSSIIIRLCNILIVVMIPFWLSAHFLFNHSEELSALFDVSYEIVVAMLAGFSLLKLAEKETNLHKNPVFWFQTGIFVYCFTTFYVSGLLDSDLLQKIWWIHNVVNLIVYLLFTIGFLSISTAAKK